MQSYDLRASAMLLQSPLPEEGGRGGAGETEGLTCYRRLNLYPAGLTCAPQI